MGAYSFISNVTVVGRAVSPDEDAQIRKLRSESDFETAKGRANQMAAFRIMMSWWPETFHNLKELCTRQRPDFIFSEALADASIDVAALLNIPLAVRYPQLPSIPQSYIPGMAGFALKHLTSEHASLWDRMQEELHRVKMLFAARHFALERRRMNLAAGIKPRMPSPKADYLIFVNHFFGLEVPRHLPPLVHPVGPVLAEEYKPIPDGGRVAEFLKTHHAVLLIAFGTHVVTPSWRIHRLIQGVNAAIKEGLLDGVIWGLKSRDDLDGSIKPPFPTGQEDILDASLDYESILSNGDPHWLVEPWVEQRAILEHPSTGLFLTHCGTGSCMESAYHGVSVLAMPFFGDQLANSKRLVTAGVAVELHKDRFTARSTLAAITNIMRDDASLFARNTLRLRRIAHVNSQRKYLAAQLIEEVMYDHELRFEDQHDNGNPEAAAPKQVHSSTGSSSSDWAGKEIRPMHLQTPDMRMGWWKKTNWDMWLLFPAFLPFLLAKNLL